MPAVTLSYRNPDELERKLRTTLRGLVGIERMTPGELARRTKRPVASISRALRGRSGPAREWVAGPSGRILEVLVTKELLAWLVAGRRK